MSYRQAPSPYQRFPPDDFVQSANFDVEDFIFPDEVPTGHGYGYEPHYPPAPETPGYRGHEPGPPFHPAPSGWAQHGRPAGPPAYNHQPCDGMHNRGTGPGPHRDSSGFVTQPPPQARQGPHPQRSPLMGGAPDRADPPPPQAHHVLQARAGVPPLGQPDMPPPGVDEFTCTNNDSGIPETEPPAVSNLDPPPESRRDTPKDDAQEATANGGGDGSDAILRPVAKVPAKRKPNGTCDLVEEGTNKKAKRASASPPLPRPVKLSQEVGDVCCCELCDVVCSGPLNLRMHVNGARHKLNEATADKGERTVEGKSLGKKVRGRFVKEGPIPAGHDQEDTLLIGLDFVTRVVSPDTDASEDVYECSLCDAADLVSSCVYQHIVGRDHRIAYIRKLKPDLADQYSNIANVYNKTGQLQRRRDGDLSAFLHNISKIAARQDGPGEMQLRLCNERESDGDDYGVAGYDSDLDDGDCNPTGTERETPGNLGGPGTDRRRLSAQPPEYPPIPRPPYDCRSPSERPPPREDPVLPRPPSPAAGRGAPDPPVTRLRPRTPSPDRPPPVTGRLPARALSPEEVPPRAPPTPISRPSPAATPHPKANTRAEDTPSPATHLPSKETTPPTNQVVSPADLPPLTQEQLRFYCSDVFIAQEYRRRFGDPTPQAGGARPVGTHDNNRTTGTSSSASSVEALLKLVSNTTVNSEKDADTAMQITRALTQATLKYRLQLKDFAVQKTDGKK